MEWLIYHKRLLDKMHEEWKKCFFDDRYRISNLGNIKRVLSNGNEKMLKGSLLNSNKTHYYKYIQIMREGKRKNYLIHRLVATAFLENEEYLPFVDHIDRNTFNNDVENLRWCTQQTNMQNTCVYRNDIKGSPKSRQRQKYSEYYIKNKDRLLGKYECDCGAIVSHCNKWNHWKSNKHRNNLTVT